MNTTISNTSFGAKVINKIPVKFREIKAEKPDFFRDYELFDETKDCLTRGYSRYDIHDIPAKGGRRQAGFPFFDDMPYQEVVDLYTSDAARDMESVPGMFEKIM